MFGVAGLTQRLLVCAAAMIPSLPSSPAPVSHRADLELAESALDGDRQAVEAVVAMLRGPELAASLRNRGATADEANDIVNDMIGDCYGGERAKGGLHRLLGRYLGKGPLAAFFHHVALRRLIGVKRWQASHPQATPDAEGRNPIDLIGSSDSDGEDAVIELLRGALRATLAKVDAERLVVVRLIESYEVPQTQISTVWGWHPSKVSRANSELLQEIRDGIFAEVKRTDPWLQLEFSDFLKLCDDASDLFGDIPR